MGQGTHDITHLLGRVAHVGGQAVNGLMAYWGYAKHANAKALWKSQVDGKVLSVLDSFNMKQNPARKIMS